MMIVLLYYCDYGHNDSYNDSCIILVQIAVIADY